jgi:spore maturation protein CgeB
MIINFIGNYQSGYVGELADESHLADSLVNLGHTVRRIPRDVWREWVLGNYKERPREIPEQMKADINIIAKWHHFFDGRFITTLREQSEAPVFYWVWDYMHDQAFPEWHVSMAKEADLYLSGEAGVFSEYIKLGIKPYYFQFDVCDGRLPVFSFPESEKIHDISFFGSYLGQGDRVTWLKEINKVYPIKIFSWNYEEWRKEGFDASPAVYGQEFNQEVAKSKIILGFNVNANCWGYWSNRVGKVTVAGGFLLQQYAPGMEQFLTSNVDYFSSPEEAINKIGFYLTPEGAEIRNKKIEDSKKYAYKFTSQYKVAQLVILIERYLKGNPKLWNKLP